MSNVYLYSASSICNQKAFGNPGFSRSIIAFENNSEIDHPEYKDIIPAIKLRRMGKLSRMAIANSEAVLKSAALDKVEGIIIGTGLGSLEDTERFLQKFIPAGKSLVPPVSFIQSGHNTFSGQIALYYGNTGYNMTHVHQHLSFEHALIDAKLFVEEQSSDVLVGALDEKIPILTELANQYELDEQSLNQLSEGASFMIAGADLAKGAARLVDVGISIKGEDGMKGINSFLKQNETRIEEIDRVLMGKTFNSTSFDEDFPEALVYTDFCGQYFSSSAFGCHLGVDLIQTESLSKILIVNSIGKKDIGLILLENVKL